MATIPTEPLLGVLAHDGAIWAIPNYPQDLSSGPTASNVNYGIVSIDPVSGDVLARLDRPGSRDLGAPRLAWSAGRLWAAFGDQGADPGYEDDRWRLLQLDPVTLEIEAEVELPDGPRPVLAAFEASADHLWLSFWEFTEGRPERAAGLRFDPVDGSFVELPPGLWATGSDRVYRVDDVVERVDPVSLPGGGAGRGCLVHVRDVVRWGARSRCCTAGILSIPKAGSPAVLATSHTGRMRFRGRRHGQWIRRDPSSPNVGKEVFAPGVALIGDRLLLYYAIRESTQPFAVLHLGGGRGRRRTCGSVR